MITGSHGVGMVIVMNSLMDVNWNISLHGVVLGIVVNSLVD